MTFAQRLKVTMIIASLQDRIVIYGRHGDCVGADAQFHDIVLRDPQNHVIIHPPIDQSHRAHCDLFAPPRVTVLAPQTHFARNRSIVLNSQLMIAAPRDMIHQPRGGTWYTYDFAMKIEVPTAIVFPDGSYKIHGEWAVPRQGE